VKPPKVKIPGEQKFGEVLAGFVHPDECFEGLEVGDSMMCCSDGLSAMTAALRMRHLSHTALLQQNFLEHAGNGKP
jgi:hypothetical protein